MTQVIEIVVLGAVGSGKSHVLELIDRALHDEYGQHVQVASHELSRERYMGSPGTKPKVAETIFNLREQTPASPKLGEAVSFMLDPIEQAIESTARVLRDEHEHLARLSAPLGRDVSPSPVYKHMSAHLEALLSQRLKRVGDHGHR